jgi:putative NADH-flavin reductase
VHVAIVGASRGVGRAAVDAALAGGHTVTALARSAGTLNSTAATLILGDVLDPAVVGRALEGSDAVLVALGVTPGSRSTTPEDICSRGTQVVLDEMARRSIDRIAVVSSYGVGPTRDRMPLLFRLFAKTVLKGIMKDKERQEADVRASSARWTIVQPVGLTDGPATGKAYAAADGSTKTNRIARTDVAAVCIEALANDRFIRESVAVSAP